MVKNSINTFDVLTPFIKNFYKHTPKQPKTQPNSIKMVKFSIEKLREIMNDSQNIRNISVIAHVDHGKTTLSDSLIAKAGIISSTDAGQKCLLDFEDLEKEKGITIKSTSISLHFEYINPNDPTIKREFLINMIDSPGHVDFSSEVTAALRVTDGALVVVDSVEGVCVQTETVLRQAMQEKVRPVLVVNKVDRQILELKADPETIYQNFIKVIDGVNVVISNYEQPDMGNLFVEPSRGNVAFGAGKDCWAFTLRTFARMYSKKFKVSEEVLMQKLWGDNYFDTETKKWSTEDKNKDGKPVLKRGFCSFILEPIMKLMRAIMESNFEQLDKLLTSLEIEIKQDVKTFKEKDLIKLVMSKWMNAADTLLEMIVVNLPSPKEAQKYRSPYLYEGPSDDICSRAISECDPKGPLMVFVSKMIPNNDQTRFFAFGRVFSGTISAGQNVRIMGPNYRPGSKEDLFEKKITSIVIMMGKGKEAIADVPCGNTVGILGVDNFLTKTGTITDNAGAHCIKNLKYSVSPVVKVAVEPKNMADLPKLLEGLKKLAKSDTLAQCSLNETGQNIIAASGELHIETCVYDLLHKYTNNLEVKISEPTVTYKETILEQSSLVCMVKTPNHHNRIYCQAEPLTDPLSEAIERAEITKGDDAKTRARKLVDEFQWEKDSALKIWCFGPENQGPNLLVDQTKGIQYMNEIKDSMGTAFQYATKEGVLAEEEMRGVRFNILDAKLIPDAIHRGPGQMLPAARRLYHGAEYTAQPRLLEPIFLCEITTNLEGLKGVRQCLNKRRGTFLEEIQVQGTPLYLVKAHLPAAESFGFTGLLRSLTGGVAFPQCIFSHWAVIQGDPFDLKGKTNALVKDIRARKGLNEALPNLEDILDKL